MPAPPAALALAAAGLAVTDVPLPAELGALALVGLVLHWALQRFSGTDQATLDRINKLETQLEDLRTEWSKERHLKHDALNRAASMSMTVRLLVAAARQCTCGNMHAILELVDRVGTDGGR